MRSRSSTANRPTLSEVPVATTVPEPLARQLRQLSDLECSSLAATARRLIALGVKTELARLGAEQVAR